MAKWIICCGMIRSGSTLQYQITKGIVEKYHIADSLGYYENNDLTDLINSKKNEHKCYLIKTHEYFELVKSDLMIDSKYIYSYRDIRDVIVSLMNKNNAPFDKVFNAYWADKNLQTYENWIATKNIYISKYETLTNNYVEEIINISKFLGVRIESDFVDFLVNSLSIDKQKNKIKQTDYSTEAINKYGTNYSKDTLMHENHIFSGETEQWKKALTKYQIAKVESYWENWLKSNGYNISKSIFKIKWIFKLVNYIGNIRRMGLSNYIKRVYDKLKKH